MGLFLRFVFVFPVGINFRYLTHAHSHVAMLGWVYLMLFSFFVYYFIPKPSKAYSRLFWVTEIAVLGMMLSFPFQGYAAISISFSTLHIFCSYYFFRLVWKDQAGNDLPERTLLKTSLLFMLLSTIGIWFLGPAVATVGNQSAFFNIAIQFFLHFQFNGWFLFAVLAVFFKILSRLGLKIDLKKFKWFFLSLIFCYNIDNGAAGELVCFSSNFIMDKRFRSHFSACRCSIFYHSAQTYLAAFLAANFRPCQTDVRICLNLFRL